MKHDKYFDGHVNITLRFPIRFKVDAEDVEYLDDKGKSYFNEEWEYYADEVIEQNDEIKNFVAKNKRYIEEIVIEEY